MPFHSPPPYCVYAGSRSTSAYRSTVEWRCVAMGASKSVIRYIEPRKTMY